MEGPLFAPSRLGPPVIAVAKGASGLARGLGENDLLFSHFGITVFEALAAGVPVITFNPSAYHERLAAATEFPPLAPCGLTCRRCGISWGTRRGCARWWRGSTASSAGNADGGCARCCSAFTPAGPRPARSAEGRGIPWLADSRSEHTADVPGAPSPTCRALPRREKAYGKRYFFSRLPRAVWTHLTWQDFDSIRAASRPRVRIIPGSCWGTNRTVSWSTSGAHMDRSSMNFHRNPGLPGYGVDVSGEAVAFVSEETPHSRRPRSLRGQMGRKTPPPTGSPAVTLWYVIEHFQPD